VEQVVLLAVKVQAVQHHLSLEIRQVRLTHLQLAAAVAAVVRWLT
jgi:hypothetical protein